MVLVLVLVLVVGLRLLVRALLLLLGVRRGVRSSVYLVSVGILELRQPGKQKVKAAAVQKAALREVDSADVCARPQNGRHLWQNEAGRDSDG